MTKVYKTIAIFTLTAVRKAEWKFRIKFVHWFRCYWLGIWEVK